MKFTITTREWPEGIAYNWISEVRRDDTGEVKHALGFFRWSARKAGKRTAREWKWKIERERNPVKGPVTDRVDL